MRQHPAGAVGPPPPLNTVLFGSHEESVSEFTAGTVPMTTTEPVGTNTVPQLYFQKKTLSP